MKQRLFLTVAALTVCLVAAYGQVAIGDGSIVYGYDGAGNRISRQVITVPLSHDSIAGQLNSLKSVDAGENGNENKDDFTSSIGARKVYVYPNPVKSNLTIEIREGGEEEDYRLMLFDVSGKLLIETKRRGNGSEPVDMGSYPTGTYLLIIAAGDESTEYRIVKQ